MHGVRNWFWNLGRNHNRYISLPGWFCCINSEDRLGPGLGALLAPVLHNLEALLLMMIVIVMVVMFINNDGGDGHDGDDGCCDKNDV